VSAQDYHCPDSKTPVTITAIPGIEVLQRYYTPVTDGTEPQQLITGRPHCNWQSSFPQLADPWNQLQRLSDYHAQSPLALLQVCINLQDTDRTQQHEFTVSYELADGDTCSATTP
jgi:hypothetical protein